MERAVCAVILLFVALFWGAADGFAAGEEQGKIVLDLKGCIARAISNAPEMGEAAADIDLAASSFDEARENLFPTVEFLGLIGPVPQAKGNQVYSTDSINQTDRW